MVKTALNCLTQGVLFGEKPSPIQRTAASCHLKLQRHAIAGRLPAELVDACQQVRGHVGEDDPAGARPGRPAGRRCPGPRPSARRGAPAGPRTHGQSPPRRTGHGQRQVRRIQPGAQRDEHRTPIQHPGPQPPSDRRWQVRRRAQKRHIDPVDQRRGGLGECMARGADDRKPLKGNAQLACRADPDVGPIDGDAPRPNAGQPGSQRQRQRRPIPAVRSSNQDHAPPPQHAWQHRRQWLKHRRRRSAASVAGPTRLVSWSTRASETI
jgi:hypothetical protein